ncbi:MAG: hypothetical protein IPM34_01850 [Saprospiraceae bacterium]|nr:hypothetical protein [Saprospiraceae bacterium]
MDDNIKIIRALELHSVNGIRECFKNGLSHNQIVHGRTLFEEFITGNLRSENFIECVKVFVEFGLVFENLPLHAVLLNDSITLKQIISNNPDVASKRYTIKSAFTPLEDVTLLSICAESNHLFCSQVLIDEN